MNKMSSVKPFLYCIIINGYSQNIIVYVNKVRLIVISLQRICLLSGCFSIFFLPLVFCVFIKICPSVVFFYLSWLGDTRFPKFEDLCFSSIQEYFQPPCLSNFIFSYLFIIFWTLNKICSTSVYHHVS